MTKWLKNILAVIVLSCLIWYLMAHWQLLKELLRLNPKHLLILFCLLFLVRLTTSCAVQSLLAALSIKTRLRDMFWLQNATLLLNYAPMKFGTIFRANHLKRHYGLAYSHFATFYLYILFLMTATAATVGMIVLVTVYTLNGYESKIMAMIFLITILSSLVFLFVPLPIPAGQRRFIAIIRNFLTSRAGIAKQRKTILVSTVLLAVNYLLTALRIGIIYHSMGIDVHPAGFLVLGALGFVTLFISITPGSLGIREFVLGAGAVVLGLPLEVGVMAAMIDRAILISYAFTVGGGSTLYLWCKSPADFKQQSTI